MTSQKSRLAAEALTQTGSLVEDLRALIISALGRAAQTVNSELVGLYCLERWSTRILEAKTDGGMLFEGTAITKKPDCHRGDPCPDGRQVDIPEQGESET